MPIKDRFVEYLTKRYPNLENFQIAQRTADNLISPFTVTLPQQVLHDIQDCAQKLFNLRTNPDYQNFIFTKFPEYKPLEINNYAICNSLDFHYNETQGLKLIEVNTNAAFLALGLTMYDFKKVKPPIAFSFSDFLLSIQQEYELLFSKTISLSNLKVAIVDDQPLSQRLSVEFLLYREMFQEHGVHCEILDYRDPRLREFNFIYNRHTDFFLKEPDSAMLRKIYLEKKACVSPHPLEYISMADKSLFEDWHTRPEAKSLLRYIPETHSLSAEKKDQIWSYRKNFFFKPKNAFGSKQSYRGSSISRKAFDEICNENFIAQEFLTPSEASFEINQEHFKFKYDLRAHFYQNKVQMITARLYQGQVTNLQTTLGGFTSVEFT